MVLIISKVGTPTEKGCFVSISGLKSGQGTIPFGRRVTQEADAFGFCTPARSPASLRCSMQLYCNVFDPGVSEMKVLLCRAGPDKLC